MERTTQPSNDNNLIQNNIDGTYNFGTKSETLQIDDENTEEIISRLDTLNVAIDVNERTLGETLLLSKPNAMKKEILFLPKILVPKTSQVATERLSAAKVKEINSIQKELDKLHQHLQQEKLLKSNSQPELNRTPSRNPSRNQKNRLNQTTGNSNGNSHEKPEVYDYDDGDMPPKSDGNKVTLASNLFGDITD